MGKLRENHGKTVGNSTINWCFAKIMERNGSFEMFIAGNIIELNGGVSSKSC